ncbi:MAG: hypothetical protein QOH96_82 [Blastocatellia bacterium]|jgi:hypothetical protein|nr:hypothetical protein [Blastocatellia bacterium]
MNNDSIGQRFKQSISLTLDESLTGLPVWFRIPVGIARHFPRKSSPRKTPNTVAARLAKTLLKEDLESLRRIRGLMLELLSEDRLENGGWGKRNNKVLRKFFGDLPDDFDTEGSITLTRWVIDALAFSQSNQKVKSRFLDERLHSYLDARFDRRKGASGRVGTPDLLGRRFIQPAPRHTASSILCYLGLDADRFLHSASEQINYLVTSRDEWMNNLHEVGHPDILRSLFLSRYYLPDQKSAETDSIDLLIKDCSSFLWNWLNSRRSIPLEFGPEAALYLRLYSLCSISDISAVQSLSQAFLPLRNFRLALHEDVQEFCTGGKVADHRVWGFRTLLLWSYLCSPSAGEDIGALKELLLSVIDVGGDFREGFCVYWAVLFAVADCVLQNGGYDVKS